VSSRINDAWPTFHKLAPELPEDPNQVAPVAIVELVVEAWTHVADKTQDLQQQLEAIRLKEREHPKEMLEKISKVVAEGDVVHISLHQ
jgi:hypothetical protein